MALLITGITQYVRYCRLKYSFSIQILLIQSIGPNKKKIVCKCRSFETLLKNYNKNTERKCYNEFAVTAIQLWNCKLHNWLKMELPKTINNSLKNVYRS